VRKTLRFMPAWRGFGIPVLFCCQRQAGSRSVVGFLCMYRRKRNAWPRRHNDPPARAHFVGSTALLAVFLLICVSLKFPFSS
jgi:hypothetical protein